MNTHELLTLGLTNAVLATLIAMAGWLLTRFWKNPHVASVVWLAVLLKLVTPPVVALPVGFDRDVERQSQISDFEEQPSIASATPRSPESTRETTITANVRPEPVEAPQPAIAPFPVNEPAGRTFQPVPNRISSPEPASQPVDETARQDFQPLLLGGWLAGTVLVGLITLVRAVKFHRMLHQMTIVDHEMQRAVVHVASRLALKRCPAIRSVAANVGPMVWAGSRRPLVIVPRPLWDSLGDDERETLLAHELAHVVRRDHWVRRFEALVLALYWWLPTTWLAVRRREAAAETCCDALVLNHYPDHPQAYAEALLTAVAVPSTTRTPALASGLGRNHELKERLTMIVHDRVPRRPGRAVRWGMLLVTTLVLAVGATLEPEHAAQASDPTIESEHAAPASDTPSSAEAAPVAAKSSGDAAPTVDEILFFHASWSVPSQTMTPLVEALRQEGLPFRIVDVDLDPEFAKALNVTTIPAFVSMRIGKEIDRAVGVKTEKSLREFAKRHPLADRDNPLSRESRHKIIDGLIAVIQDEKQPADVKAQAMRSLGSLAKGTDDETRVEAVLMEAAEKSDDDQAILGAAEALHRLGSPKGVELMWRVLVMVKENHTKRWAVIEKLTETESAPPTPETLQLLARHADGYTGGMTGGRGTMTYVALLWRTRSSADGLRRLITAIETLGSDEIMNLTASSPERDTLLAILSEATPTTDDIAAVLVEALSHNDAGIRKAAAKALGNTVSAGGGYGRGMGMSGSRGGAGAMRGATRGRSPMGLPIRPMEPNPFGNRSEPTAPRPAAPSTAELDPAPSDDTVRKELREPLIAAGRDEQATPESRIAALTALARLSKTKTEMERAEEVVKEVLAQVDDERERRELSWLLFDLTDGRGGRNLVWPDPSSIPKEEAGRVIRELNARGIVPPDAEAVANLTKLTVLYGTKSGKRNGVRYESFHNETQAIFDRLTSRPEGIEKLVDAIVIAQEPSSQERGENAISGDTPVRGMLLVHLSGIRPTSPEVAKVLAKALSHEDPDIRTAAATALGNYSASNDATKENPFGNRVPRAR